MGEVLFELEQVLRSKKLTSEEANVLMSCKADAIRGFTIGAGASGGVVWLATRRLGHILRTNLVGGHASVGVFLGHSGWSSVIESLSLGGPIIGLPMKSDQPLNARLMVELGVALEVERDNNNLDFAREEVAKVIKEVMNSQSSVRMKAKKLSEKIKVNEDEVIAAAVEQLKNICTKK